MPKDVRNTPPDICAAVFSHAFVIEAVDGCDLPRFVISTDESYSVWVSDFEAEKEEEGFKGIKTTINEVA